MNIALLFSGQGSQYVGMGKNIYSRFSVARKTFEQANDILGFDLTKLCLEGSFEELTKTENTQPAILTASVAAFRVYIEEFGVNSFILAGHSLGEFSALTCAGVMEFSDALRITKQRGRFMQEASEVGTGIMAAISCIEEEVIIKECRRMSIDDKNIAVVSNYNSPDQIVISGHKKTVEEVAKKLEEKGGRVVFLKVSTAFHSPLMFSAANRLNEELFKYEYKEGKWPVISNVTALPYSHNEVIELLTSQMISPVKWSSSMKYIKDQGVLLAVELGPREVLRNLMKKNVTDIKAFAFDKEDDVQSLKKELDEFKDTQRNSILNTTVLAKCLAIAVCTRNRNWDNDEYQTGVVQPYRRIKHLQNELEKEGKSPTIDQMRDALEMLKSVFITKKLPIEEQLERFNQVFDETKTRHLFQDFKMPSNSDK